MFSVEGEEWIVGNVGLEEEDALWLEEGLHLLEMMESFFSAHEVGDGEGGVDVERGYHGHLRNGCAAVEELGRDENVDLSAREFFENGGLFLWSFSTLF